MGQYMIDHITNIFSASPREWVTLILGILPISEVRGAIPFGLAAGLGLKKTLLLSICGNLIPIIPTLFLFEPVSVYLRRFWIFKRFFDWLFERTKRNADVIEKFEMLGLLIFVAIPLPLTGAWSGCVAATMFKVRFRYAVIAISLGVLGAALIVTAVCLTGGGLLRYIFLAK
jgi:uncharacterized membrane protein